MNRIGESSDPRGRITGPPSALDRFEEIASKIEGKRVVLFLDYDGTLTPIVDRPEEACLDEGTKRALEAASQVCLVAIVSGRDLDDVRERVGIESLYYAGSHGFDIAGPGGLRLQSPQAKFLPILERAERDLRRALERIEGAQVERKRFSLAAHYRNVPEGEVDRVEEAVSRLADTYGPLRRSEGKKVFELQPKIDWHKGKAVLWLLDALGLEGPEVLPLYIGDDTTDEDAFRSLADRGVTIRVEEDPRSTEARYRVANPEEVGVFLGKLISEVIEAGSSPERKRTEEKRK